MGVAGRQPKVVLSFDFEDWHQLVRRRVGSPDWRRRGHAFEKQMAAVLEWLETSGSKATFFILGITAEQYPDLVEEVAEHGHEIACHGHDHQPVFQQSESEFREDVERSLRVLDRLVGVRPLGYRAPAFSINRDARWAFRTLADLGFLYDSSLYDSPRVPRRIRPIPASRFQLEVEPGRTMWEFPLAVSRRGPLLIPIGGGSYWRFLPGSFIRRSLHRLAEDGHSAVLYFHPYEFDREPLRADLVSTSAKQRARVRLRSAFRGFRRESVLRLLTDIASEFRFVTYEDVLTDIERPRRARTSALSGQSSLV